MKTDDKPTRARSAVTPANPSQTFDVCPVELGRNGFKRQAPLVARCFKLVSNIIQTIYYFISRRIFRYLSAGCLLLKITIIF